MGERNERASDASLPPGRGRAGDVMTSIQGCDLHSVYLIFKKHQLCFGSPRYRPRDSIRVSTAHHRLAGASQHYTVTPRSYYDFARRDALGRDGQGITAGLLAAAVEVRHARIAAGVCTTGVLEAAVVADCRHLPVHARRRRPQAARPRRAPRVVRENRRRTELD